MEPDGALQPGQVVDRFEVVGVLGTGASADVYRVVHSKLGTEHALKLLNARQRGLTDRLLQEGRVQARLRHPHIVPVTDVVEHDGRAGLVMELIEGPTLEQVVAERGKMPLSEAMALIDGVLAAVETAHSSEVLHRDLKPANILLEQRPEGYFPKVTDFGIAKVFGEDARQGRTRAGSAMGTPGYMAPEQWADAADAGAEADVFALGVILYELLSGQRPYVGSSATAVLQATMAGERDALHERVPEAPLHVAEAVERALDPDPSRRFGSVAAFRSALEGSVALADRDAATVDEAARVETTMPATPVHDGQTRSQEASTKPDLPAVGRHQRSLGISLIAVASVVLVGGLGLSGAAGAWWLYQRITTADGPAEEVVVRNERIAIPGGSFYLAEPDGEAFEAVEVEPFEIDRTEVSTASYLGCVRDGVCSDPAWLSEDADVEYTGLKGQRQPIVGVSWDQAVVYCATQGGRLPTETEWEMAALWSEDGVGVEARRAWPWGEDALDCEHANYEDCDRGRTAEVDSMPDGASAFGLLHTVGNVWEWTASDYEPEPKRGLGGVFRRRFVDHKVLKGGAWSTAAEDLDPTGRYHADAKRASVLYGFRCAYDLRSR